MTYLFVKTVHIVSARLWIGGLAALLALGLWLARHPRDALPAAVLHAAGWFGERVLVSAGMVSLLTGMGLARLSASGLQPWMLWGVLALLSVAVLDAVPLQRTLRRLNDWTERPRDGDSKGGTLLFRANALLAVNLVLLLSAVAAMVVKPVF